MPEKVYTDEVAAVLRDRGLLAIGPPPAPAGQIRYHVAVDTALLSGAAAPSTVATILRGLADQIDPSEETSHA